MRRDHPTPTGFLMRSSGNEEYVYRLVRRGVIEIDDDGRVWLRKRRIPRTGRYETIEPRRCRCDTVFISTTGYIVNLQVDDRRVLCLARRLVWMHFNGPIPHCNVISPRDGDIRNHHPSNLVLSTRAKSIRVSFARGRRRASGERNSRAVLTEQVVVEMRRLRSEGMRYDDMASRFGVSYQACHRACVGATWRHIVPRWNDRLKKFLY